MDQSKDSTIHAKGKHFSKAGRQELQGILRFARVTKQALSLCKFAVLMNCSPNTIRKELKRSAHPLCGLKDLQKDFHSPLCAFNPSLVTSNRQSPHELGLHYECQRSHPLCV